MAADESQGDAIWSHLRGHLNAHLSTTSVTTTTTDSSALGSQLVPALPDSVPAGNAPTAFHSYGLAGGDETSTITGMSQEISADESAAAIVLAGLGPHPQPRLDLSRGPGLSRAPLSPTFGPLSGLSSWPSSKPSTAEPPPLFKVPNIPTTTTTTTTTSSTSTTARVPRGQQISTAASSSRGPLKTSAPVRTTRATSNLQSQDSFGITTASQDRARYLNEHGGHLARLVAEASTTDDSLDPPTTTKTKTKTKATMASQESSQTQSSSGNERSREIPAPEQPDLDASQQSEDYEVLVEGTQDSLVDAGGGQDSQVTSEYIAEPVREPSPPMGTQITGIDYSSPILDDYAITQDQVEPTQETTQEENSFVATGTSTGASLSSYATGLSAQQNRFLHASNPARYKKYVNEERVRNAPDYPYGDPYTHSLQSDASSSTRNILRGLTPPPIVLPDTTDTQLASPPRPRHRRQQLPHAPPSQRSANSATPAATFGAADSDPAPPPPPVPIPTPPTQHATQQHTQPHTQQSTFQASLSSIVPGSVTSERSFHPPAHSPAHPRAAVPAAAAAPPLPLEVVPDSVENSSGPLKQQEDDDEDGGEVESSQPVPLSEVLARSREQVMATGDGRPVAEASVQAFGRGKDNGKKKGTAPPATTMVEDGAAVSPSKPKPKPTPTTQPQPQSKDFLDSLDSIDTPQSSFGVKRQQTSRKVYGSGATTRGRGGRGRGSSGAGAGRGQGARVTRGMSAPTLVRRDEEEEEDEGPPQDLQTPKPPSPSRPVRQGKLPFSVNPTTPQVNNIREARLADFTAITTPGQERESLRFPGEDELTSPSNGVPSPPPLPQPRDMGRERSPTVDTVESPMELDSDAEDEAPVPSTAAAKRTTRNTTKTPTTTTTKTKLYVQKSTISVEAPTNSASDTASRPHRPQRTTRQPKALVENSSSSSSEEEADDYGGAYEDSQPVESVHDVAAAPRTRRGMAVRRSREATAASGGLSDSGSVYSMPPPPPPPQQPISRGRGAVKRRRTNDTQQSQSHRSAKRQRTEPGGTQAERVAAPMVFALYTGDKMFYAADVIGMSGGTGARRKFIVRFADDTYDDLTVGGLRIGPAHLASGAPVQVCGGGNKKWVSGKLVACGAEGADVCWTGDDDHDGRDVEDRVAWSSVRRTKAMVQDSLLTADMVHELIAQLTRGNAVSQTTIAARPVSVSRSPAPSLSVRRRRVSSSGNNMTRAQLVVRNYPATGVLSDFTFIITCVLDAKDSASGWRRRLPEALTNAGAIVLDEFTDVLSFGGNGRGKGYKQHRWSARADQLRVLQSAKGEENAEEEDTAVPAIGRKILLLSDQPSGTPKYLFALALGVPCVCAQWAIDVLEEVRVEGFCSFVCLHRDLKAGFQDADPEDWPSYLLCAGESKRLNQFISQYLVPGAPATLRGILQEAGEGSEEGELAKRRQPFARMSVLCVGGGLIPSLKDDAWDFNSAKCFPPLCLAMGASTVDAVPSFAAAPRNRTFNVVVVDEAILHTLTADVKTQFGAESASTTTWLKQCLISGRLLAP
ncbi:hypothetical protein BKA62DRAFT_113204 [Auriculariales sp. MPI-PUGE-AT-0066]|nr:hypothetical protein BKA62DRAFT_113204 [Auriculariales sp. MPI-PUGE-AT-0066]